MADLILRNGRLFDPARGLDGVQDLHVADGRIVAIGSAIARPAGASELRLDGALVTPGLIDLHVHVYPEASVLGVAADSIGVQSGVTTVVDAGSAGAYSFAGFRRAVVESAATRVLCFLNFGAIGMPAGRIAELSSPDLLDADTALRIIDANRDVVKGVKARATRAVTGSLGLEALRRAKATARAAGVPLAVHVGETPGLGGRPPFPSGDVLGLLEAGDLVMHCFTARPGGLFTPDGRVLPEARAARERGVRFEVGEGTYQFSSRLLRAALEEGFAFDVISSDLSGNTRSKRVFSLPIVLSKFLAAGLTLEDVIAKATLGPARVLGLDHEIGIHVGAIADLSAFELLEGQWRFVDSEGEVLVGRQLLSPVLAVRADRVHPALTSRVYPTERYLD